jgi:hypothetical protein
MKRVLIILLLFVGLLFFGCMKVQAKPFEVQRKFDNTTKINYLEDKGNYANCDGLLTSDAVDMIREILGYFRIIAPILLILFVAIDFGTAIISNDNDALKKAQSKFVSRSIATAALFFVPTIVRAILGLDGVRSAIEIPNDPLCGTMDSYPTEYFDYSN